MTDYFVKKLAAFSRQLFLQKQSIIDAWKDPEYLLSKDNLHLTRSG